jgi:hypothetical protein
MPIDPDWNSILDDYDEKVHRVANRQFLIDTCELEFEEKITELQDAITGIFSAMFLRPLELQDRIGNTEWVKALYIKEQNLGHARDKFVSILDEVISTEQLKINSLKTTSTK